MQGHRGDGSLSESPGRADVQRVGARQPVEVLHALGRGDAGQPVDGGAPGVHRAVIADRSEAFEPAVNDSGQDDERCAAFQTNRTARRGELQSAAIRPCARASRRGRTCCRRSTSSTGCGRRPPSGRSRRPRRERHSCRPPRFRARWPSPRAFPHGRSGCLDAALRLRSGQALRLCSAGAPRSTAATARRIIRVLRTTHLRAFLRTFVPTVERSNLRTSEPSAYLIISIK